MVRLQQLLLALLAVTSSVAVSVQGTPHLMDVSFRLGVAGLGEATFFTFQQPVPAVLPYSIQDEWVQYLYPDGNTAVYNVAHIAHDASWDNDCYNSVNDNVISRVVGQGGRLEGGVLASRGSAGRGGAARKQGAAGQQQQQQRQQHQQQQQRQPFVAVKAGDVSQLAQWFQQHMRDAVHWGSSSGWQYAEPNHAADVVPVVRPAEQCQGAAAAEQCQGAAAGCDDSSSGDGGRARITLELEDVGQQEAQFSSQLQQQGRLCSNVPMQTGNAAAAAAAAAAQPVAAAGTCTHRNFLLYFGMSIPRSSGGGVVSQAQLQAFLAAEVSPRLQGFTLLSGLGFWQGESEPTVVLEVISDEAGIAAVVGDIADAYKRVFHQEAVLVKENACPKVAFV